MRAAAGDEAGETVRSLFDLRDAEIQGGVHIGEAAGRDIIKVIVNVARADDWGEIRGMIEQLRAELAKLEAGDRELREDAESSLDKAAAEAGKPAGDGEGRDAGYIASRLQKAADIALKLAAAIPAAAQLAEAIATLAQRVTLMR